MKNSLSQKQVIFGVVLLIFFISFFVSSSYRGIAHDEGIGGFRAGAMRILARQPIFDAEKEGGDPKDPARLIYIVLIAIGHKIFGFNLVAYHIFPYILQILNPCLFFIVVFRFYKSVWWGLAGTLLFIVHPFILVHLNQQHNHPIFMFFLLMLLLLFESALQNPKLLTIFGVIASLLILTRFEGGVIFVTLFYGIYILYRWKIGIPVRWLILSFGALLVTHSVFAVSFGFPIHYPIYYMSHLLQRQADYSARFSYYALTRQAMRIFLNWFFCGKLIAPFLVLLIGIGAFDQMKKRIFHPILLFVPYFLFLLFIYNGRFDAAYLAVATFCVPGFILLLLRGIQVVSSFCSGLLLRTPQNNPSQGKNLRLSSVFQHFISVAIVLVLLGFFGRSMYSLTIITEDGIPASTMWRIVKYNPPMPGNPLYKEPYAQLSREENFPIKLREELYKTVRGNYRSWYLNTLGKYAFEHNLPEKTRIHADFSYADDYDSQDKWEADRYHVDGTSPLWNDERPGRIGAFPLGKSGSFVYKFDFPKPIDHVTISDIHTQWGFGDVTKMWTSTDGEHWTLRYNNWNVRYTEDYYYQFFEDEFDGQKSLFVKYYFFAGDKTRTDDDNRGSSLEEFSLAVKYRE